MSLFLNWLEPAVSGIATTVTPGRTFCRPLPDNDAVAVFEAFRDQPAPDRQSPAVQRQCVIPLLSSHLPQARWHLPRGVRVTPCWGTSMASGCVPSSMRTDKHTR